MKLVLPATGEMSYNVEWRSVENEGRTLLNVVNYGAEAVTAAVVTGSKQAIRLTNLITGETVEQADLVLESLTPYLFSLDALDALESLTGEETEPGSGNPGNEKPGSEK